MLSERQKLILSAIIEDYIRSAEPVGSRSISKRGDIAFSPATIRNEMSDLEEMGFLEQPHTSAGRIPSNKGYRFYVDHLVPQNALSGHELTVLKQFFVDKIQEIEQIIQQAASILANLTNYTSIVLGPEIFNATLKHLQLVPLNEHTAVAIIVTNTGRVENKTVSLPEGIPMDEVERVVAILNAKLAGVPLIQLRSRLYNEVGAELGKYVTSVEQLLKVMDAVVDNGEEDRIYLSGATNILTQPEFKDVEKVKTILDLLGEHETLVKMFVAAPAGIQVKIGAENSVEAINNCSLITASFTVEGQSVGAIGILGPTRMEYGKVIGLLDYLSRDLSIFFNKWYK